MGIGCQHACRERTLNTSYWCNTNKFSQYFASREPEIGCGKRPPPRGLALAFMARYAFFHLKTLLAPVVAPAAVPAEAPAPGADAAKPARVSQRSVGAKKKDHPPLQPSAVQREVESFVEDITHELFDLPEIAHW